MGPTVTKVRVDFNWLDSGFEVKGQKIVKWRTSGFSRGELRVGKTSFCPVLKLFVCGSCEN